MIDLTKTKSKTYTTADIARLASVSTRTVTRWILQEKVPAPPRDRSGRRAFTEAHMRAVVEFANTLTPEAEWRSSKTKQEAL